MNISPVRFINRISAACVILFCFVPSVQVEGIYRLLAMAASAVWLVTALRISDFLISKFMAQFVLYAAVCVGLMFLWRMNIGSISSAFTNILQPLIVALVALISMFMFKYDPQFFEVIFTVILILICIYCIITIQAALENPYASRIANSEWLEERYEGNEHVGLYGYVYMCVFLVPMLVYKLHRRICINKLADLLTIIDLVLILTMIALAGYMIAIFCTVLGISMVILLNKITAPRVFIVMIIAILLWVNQETIIAGVLELVGSVIGDNPVYQDKLDGFLMLYEEGELGESAWGGRLSNYYASFLNVIKYPLLGCFFYGSTGGGGHSFILDTIGRFGWITAYLYFKILWEYPRMLVEEVSKNHALYFINLCIAIVFGVFDPYCQEVAVPWFVVMPYIVYLEREKAGQ